MLGVIYAGSRQLARFTGADAHILELIANRLAGAFRRVQLFEAEHSARTEAEQLAARLGQMQAVTSALVGTSSVEETASVLAESMSSHAHERERRWGSVWVVREDNIELASDLSLSPAADQIGQVPLDSGLPLAEAVRRRQPIYVSDAAQAAFEYPSIAEFPYIAKSFAVLPILLGDACLGVLVIAFETSHEFDDAERAFFAAVVDQAAQALDRARPLCPTFRSGRHELILRGGGQGIGRSLELRRHPRAIGKPCPCRARGYLSHRRRGRAGRTATDGGEAPGSEPPAPG